MAYSGILVQTGTLLAADMLNMQSTAQILIPAPPAGYTNHILGGRIIVRVGDTPWGSTSFANTWLVYGTGGNDQVNLAGLVLTNVIQNMAANTDYPLSVLPGIGTDWLGGAYYNDTPVPTTVTDAAPISITCVNVPTDGSGQMDYTLFYATLPS